jgi:hypothetical protein
VNALLRTTLLALPAVVLACSACGGGGGGGEDRKIDARVAIEEFDSSTRARTRSLSRLTRAIVTDRAGVREAALDSLDAEEADARLAAVYTLGLVLEPPDADALASSLGAVEPGERLLAAAALASLGDGRGVPVLIAALDGSDLLPLSAGGVHAWQQARFALLAFTGRDFGLRAARTHAAAAATKSRWEAWWSANASSFRVVRAKGRFAG